MDTEPPQSEAVTIVYGFPSSEEFETLEVVPSASSACKQGEVEVKDVLSAIAEKHGFSMDFDLVALRTLPAGESQVAPDEAVKGGTRLKIVARKSFPVFVDDYKSARSFVGGFQVSAPEFQKDKRWKIKTVGGTDSRPAWQLVSDSTKVAFKGQAEVGHTTKFMIFRLEADKFQATCVPSWYNFKRETTNRKLTLEEAEEFLEKKKKKQAGMNFQRWLMKNDGVASALTQDELGAADEKDEDDFDWQDNLNQKLKSKNEDEDKKARVASITNKGADEDWEHVENASDDDEANINDSDDENVEEERDYDQKQVQEEEEEEKHLSSTGKEIAKLLGASGLGSDDDSDSGSDYNDEEKEKPSKPPVAESNGKPEAEKKKRTRDAEENSPLAVKKSKSQKGGGVSSIENGTGPLTENELKSYLRKTGPIRIKDLLKKLKNRMGTAEEKKRFKEIFLIAAVKTKDPATGEVLAKLKK